MGKGSRKCSEISERKNNNRKEAKKSALWDEKAVDPSLALLFASSAGPVKAPPKSRYEGAPPPRKQILNEDSEEESGEEAEEGDDVELSSVDEDLEEADIADLSEDEENLEQGEEEGDGPNLDKIIEASKPERKRKRKTDEEDLEGKYMQKLANEEEREDADRAAQRGLKRQRLMADQEPNLSKGSEDLDSDDEAKASEVSNKDEGAARERITPSDVPQHESLAPSGDAVELEKASRTVFLANVSTEAISSKPAKKTLLSHMSSFLAALPSPPEGNPAHRVESLRFRSTAYAGTALPKRAAFAKKDLMATTTKSTNAYVVYSTAYAAREAVKKLNGSMVLERHLRVDGVAHPAKTDHRRCVFVGNLGFVDDESQLDQSGENERKRSKIPSDIEEGLWRQFGKAGTVESVRVIRDEKTRVGKGFAYVQFVDPNAVEAALLLNEKKYPPMLPRVLRVVRAKALRKTALASASTRENPRGAKSANQKRIYNPKMTSEASSLRGRAGKLLGRAGAAKFKLGEGSGANGMAMGKRGTQAENNGIEGIARAPESFVFEGYRASAKSGKPKDLKMGRGGGKKKAGKPKTRSSKRASEWKKGGGKKA